MYKYCSCGSVQICSTHTITIEIQGNRVIQVRGVGNCSATPEVDKFVKAWEQRVLNLIETAA